MNIVSIRGVDDDVWAEFKSGAASNKMKMSEYFEKLLKQAGKENNWKEILYGKKCLDDNDAKKIMKSSKEFRKSFEMREFQWS